MPHVRRPLPIGGGPQAGGGFPPSNRPSALRVLILLLLASTVSAQTELRLFTASLDVAFPGLTPSESAAKIANVRGVLTLAEQFALNGPQLPLSTLGDFGISSRVCVLGAATFDTTTGIMIPLTESPMSPRV